MKLSDGMPQVQDASRIRRLDEFAGYVAMLPWFNTNVLHKLYLNIFKGNEAYDRNYASRAITCADVLQSPGVKRIISNVYVLENEIQNELRYHFAQNKNELLLLGQFMHAYANDCREHFLGPTYIESYRIEANFILSPNSEATRISQHIINRMNQARSFDQKKKSVAYYLDILEKEGAPAKYGELIKFLKGVQNYTNESEAVPEEWKSLKDLDKTKGESISIKIPLHVREKILKEIAPKITSTEPGILYALIIGINAYLDSRVFPLQGCVSDAKAVFDFLNANTLVDHQSTTQQLLDAQATRSAIIHSLQSLVSIIKPEDTFLFYYSGYGGIEDRTSEMNEVEAPDAESRSEVTRFLVCHDTTASLPGLAYRELEYLLSKFPKESTQVVILDCSFKRDETVKLTEWQKVRSLAWREQSRPASSFVWATEGKLYDPAMRYTGVTLFASGDYQNAYENAEGGSFTRSFLEAIRRNKNNSSLAGLFSSDNSMRLNFSIQTPSYEIKGNYDPNQIFLDGYLKKIVSNAISTFFIEDGIDAPQLKDKASRFLSDEPNSFGLTEDLAAADYMLKWQPDEMWICRKDENQYPVATISIRDEDTLGTIVQYFTHIAKWEKVKNWEASSMPGLGPVDLQIFEVNGQSNEQAIDLQNNQYSFDYTLYSNNQYRKEIILEVTNKGTEPVFCSILYLSNRFEINSEVLDDAIVRLEPGQTARALHGDPIHLELASESILFNAPLCDCYFKLLVHSEFFGAEQLDMPPLPAPSTAMFQNQNQQQQDPLREESSSTPPPRMSKRQTKRKK